VQRQREVRHANSQLARRVCAKSLIPPRELCWLRGTLKSCNVIKRDDAWEESTSTELLHITGAWVTSLWAASALCQACLPFRPPSAQR
jgi:hypothetical protein